MAESCVKDKLEEILHQPFTHTKRIFCPCDLINNETIVDVKRISPKVAKCINDVYGWSIKGCW